MSYAERRKERAEAEQNTDVVDFTWEEQNTSLLHSGFIEPTNQNPPKSRLQVHVYYDMGRYWIRLEDRTLNEQAFTTISSLASLFQELEEKLQADELVFRPSRSGRNGYGNP